MLCFDELTDSAKQKLRKRDMTNQLGHYGLLAKKHWKKFRPKMYAELEKSGELMPVLLSLQERVSNQVLDLLEKGFQVHEAEEVVRDQIYLPSEDDVPNLYEDGEDAATIEKLIDMPPGPRSGLFDEEDH